MTYNDQQKYLKEGFLVIPIGFPGETNPPESLQDFHSMRNNSYLPSSSFSDNQPSILGILPNTIACQGGDPEAFQTNEKYVHVGIEDMGCNDVDESIEEESGLFEYASDQSHYSLDETKMLRKAQIIEHAKWNEEKASKQRFDLFHPAALSDDESDKVIKSK